MIPQRAVDLVAEFEGFRSHAYLCSAGVWTVGYGTTELDGRPVQKGDVLSEPQAMVQLRRDLEGFWRRIRPSLVHEPNEAETVALLSLAYNIGVTAFVRSSVVRNFNGLSRQSAANAFLLWNKITVNGRKRVSRGLMLRRERERAIFLGEE